MVLDNK